MKRHFCRVGERFVHYRRCGAGPAVVLLHQTPQSSVTMEPLMRRLQDHATCIAIDTPGFGLSEPLPGDSWSMADLAQALADTLDALGVRRAAFCGHHTGATIAAEFALRWPQRVASLALDGYTAFTAQERTAILPHQLYRFQPREDGTHLQWAWSRFRDGWMFFPWSVRTLATRRDADMPAPQILHDWQMMELLRSGESHLSVYPAVFGWDGVAAASALQVPTLIAGTAEDQLYPHLDRLHSPAPQVTLLRLPNAARESLQAAQIAHTLRHLADVAEPPPVSDAPDPAADGRWRGYAAGLAVSATGWHRPGAPLLVLHGAGSVGALERARVPASVDGPVLAVDLPGHGDTGGPVPDPAGAADRVAQAVRELGLGAPALWGRGLGAAVAVELALLWQAQGATATPSLDLQELRLWQDGEQAAWCAGYASPIVPQWDGAHLLRLWHEIRDRQFFLPWFMRTRAAVRAVEPQLDAAALTAEVFAALRCSDWPLAHRHWLTWPVPRVAQLGCPVRWHAQPGDGWERDLQALRALTPGAH